jgi:ribonuclease BN (tRNA processing enzyme)
MEVTFIGTGTGEPSPRRGSPALIVRAAGTTVLFDSGPGTMRQLSRIGIDYNDLDAVCYTHFHADHIGDLPALLFATKSPVDPRVDDLPIYGPRGLSDLYRGLVGVLGDQIVSNDYRVLIHELWRSEKQFHTWTLQTIPVPHTGHSIAYRIEAEGTSIVYSGDTERSNDLIELAKGCELLILECSFPEGAPVKGHLTPSTAGLIASEADVGKLALTHFYPICDRYDIAAQCRETYGGDVVIARDFLTLHV